MGEIVLKESILEEVKSDPVLSGKIAVELGVTASSMYRILRDNDKRLTQAGILAIIRDHQNLPQDTELLEEMQEPAKEKVA